MSETMGPRGCVPKHLVSSTVSPGIHLWGRRMKRHMLGQERLALQMMSQHDVVPKNKWVSGEKQGKLAGDMYNLGSFGQVVMCLFAAVPL